MLISNFMIKIILNQIRDLKHYDEDDIDMMRYSLQSILWEIEKIIIIFIVFALFGYQLYFVFTLIVLMSIRIFAGGYHSNSAFSCLVISFIGFLLAIMVLPKIPLNNVSFVLLSLFSLLITVVAAPIRSVQKDALQDKKNDPQKKMIAFAITLFWLIILFITKTSKYAPAVLWIIVLQNIQLIFEYIRRKEDRICQ